MAKNGLKMGKKALCLIFAFLLSIESMAAVVGDYDGAAFVTKAEFEELKDSLNVQIDKYNESINEKISGSIAMYLKGLEVAQQVHLKNNLATLQKNYNVYWSGQTTGVMTDRVLYGSQFEFQIGSRGTGYGASNVRQAKATSTINGNFKKFPIITEEKETTTSGTITRRFINYWEERKPWITYLGFFIYNGDDYAAWMSTNKKGNFFTEGLNPNTNTIFKRQDQWWSPGNGYGSNFCWAMSIWGLYSTKAQNKDTKSIYIYPSAGNTYCWNESNQTNSSGRYATETEPVPSITNGGSWVGSGSGTVYSGSLPMTGYTTQTRATFPWCHTQYAYKDLYDDRLRTITGVTAPISDGLLLSSDSGPGTLEIKAKGTASGSFQTIVKSKDNKRILKSQTDTVTTTEKTIKIDIRSLDEGEEFNIWIKYTPSSNATLTVSDVAIKRLYYVN